jgi:hypothetical protein
MKRLKTGPMKSETKQKLVVLITANEKISNFRNSAKSNRTVKTIVQALCRGVPVAIRTYRWTEKTPYEKFHQQSRLYWTRALLGVRKMDKAGHVGRRA